MKINKLIKLLKKVKEEKGNVNIEVYSFCGTNSSLVHFDIKKLESNKVDEYMNGHGTFCLPIEISELSKKDITDGVKDMERLGYDFYCSQFVSRGLTPRKGLSPCEWHNPW